MPGGSAICLFSLFCLFSSLSPRIIQKLIHAVVFFICLIVNRLLRVKLKREFPCWSVFHVGAYIPLCPPVLHPGEGTAGRGEWATCISGKDILGNRNSICKGPEVGP